MAIGNAVLDVVLEEGFMEAVQHKAIRFRQHLAELADSYPDLLEDLRGSGLLIGMKAKVPCGDIVQAFRDQGLLVLTAGDNVVRILPPLIITEDEISLARQKMVAGLDAVRQAQKG